MINAYRDAAEDWRTREACARYFQGDYSGAELLAELDRVAMLAEKRWLDAMDAAASERGACHE